MDRPEIIDGVAEAGVLAGRHHMIALATCVDTTNDSVKAHPAAWAPAGVHESGNLLKPVPSASHRPGAGGSDCHTTMIGEKDD